MAAAGSLYPVRGRGVHVLLALAVALAGSAVPTAACALLLAAAARK